MGHSPQHPVRVGATGSSLGPGLLAAAILANAAACTKSPTTMPQQPDAELPTLGSGWSIDTTTFDPEADRCSDFYRSVCGGWLDTAAPPEGQQHVGRTRALVDEATADLYDDLLEGDAAGDAEVLRLQTYYAACLADGNGSARSRQTRTAWLDRIGGPEPIPSLVRALHEHGINVLFRYQGVPDPADPTAHRGQLQQGHLLVSAGSDDSIRPALLQHIEASFGGLVELSAQEAGALADLELALAAHALPFADDAFESPETEHALSTAAIAALAPAIDWDAYFELVGVPADATLNVKSPPYLEHLGKRLGATSEATLRRYLQWKFLAVLRRELPSDEPGAPGTRHAHCRLSTLRALGVELSRQFAARAMGPSARDDARALAERVRASVVRAVQSNEWLSESGRAQTVEKLAATDLKVGFPDDWPSTGAFEIHPDAHLDNVLAARVYEQRRRWARASAPQRRASWEMTVRPNEAWGMAAARLTIVNGYPDASTNSIVLPAASLQPPLFDAAAPPEVNYATFGTLVAHELIHVAENYLSDATGRARTIWTPADLEQQAEQMSCIVEQATAYGLDGEETKDENVADLSGIRLAYEAMVEEVGPRLHEPGADGLTAEQRFFVAYGQNWCEYATPEYAKAALESDYHAPPRFRVNGIVANMPQFHRAFRCEPPASVCTVW